MFISLILDLVVVAAAVFGVWASARAGSPVLCLMCALALAGGAVAGYISVTRDRELTQTASEDLVDTSAEITKQEITKRGRAASASRIQRAAPDLEERLESEDATLRVRTRGCALRLVTLTEPDNPFLEAQRAVRTLRLDPKQCESTKRSQRREASRGGGQIKKR